MLLMVFIRQRIGFQYGVLAFVFVLFPELTSSMAKFKDIFFMLLELGECARVAGKRSLGSCG